MGKVDCPSLWSLGNTGGNKGGSVQVLDGKVVLGAVTILERCLFGLREHDGRSNIIFEGDRAFFGAARKICSGQVITDYLGEMRAILTVIYSRHLDDGFVGDIFQGNCLFGIRDTENSADSTGSGRTELAVVKSDIDGRFDSGILYGEGRIGTSDKASECRCSGNCLWSIVN